MSALNQFTIKTLAAYALALALLAGLYGAFTARPSQSSIETPRPFSPVLPSLSEVDTAEAAALIESSGIGRENDPNNPFGSDAPGSEQAGGQDDSLSDAPRITAVVIEGDEPFAFVRAGDSFLKLAVDEQVGDYRLISLTPSLAEFERSDGEVSTQSFFSVSN